MTLERVLQISVAALAAMGTLLFGIGQQSVLLPVLSATAAVLSFYVTDIAGWVRLNRSVANVAALGAVVIALADFVNFDRGNQLLALGNLLVYLQAILLFQQKDERIYWQLLMLSLLQVMVATALNFGLLFGVLLIIYMLLVLFALSLFLLLREASLAAGDDSGHGTARGVARNRRQAPQFESLADRGEIPVRRLLSAIGASAACQGVLTLCLTVVLFVIVPRTGYDHLVASGRGVQRMVGFSESVELGKLGRAYQSTDVVMTVQFEDVRKRPLTMHEPPLFRGAVLDTYKSRLVTSQLRSGWSLDSRIGRGHRSRGIPSKVLSAFAGNDAVVQQTKLKPMHNENAVFFIAPVYDIKGNADIEYDVSKEQLQRRKASNRELSLSLPTAGFQRIGGQVFQRDINPATHGVVIAPLLQMPRVSSSSFEEDGEEPKPIFPQLRAEAERLLAEMPDNPNSAQADRIQQARALERYFLTDSRFRYSLEGQKRDRDLDPVEDFIANTPVGHCEYYASALALMLRSQNIPARIVIGFKGGRWNSYLDNFQVEQRNAHSWVEVYLRPDQIPADLVDRVPPQQSVWRYGGWLRLDPTPGSGGAMTGQTALTLMDRARELADYGQHLWTQYVVGLDARRQREAIYRPLANFVGNLKHLFTAEMWTETVPAFFASLGKAETWSRLWDRLRTPGGMFSAVLAVVLLVWLWRRFGSRLPRFRRRRQASTMVTRNRKAVVVEFYERFESLLARYGMTRSENQTQHEFAVTVGGEFRAQESLRPLAKLPRQLTDLFYCVRFGGQTLDKQQAEAVEQYLAQLDQTLSTHDATSDGT